MSILNDGQQRILNEAVNWFKNSSQQVFEIAGPAGSGKSFLIVEILKALGLQTQNYAAMAYTGQAAIVMRTRGFCTAKSIHSTLYEVVEYNDTSEVSEKFGIPVKKKIFRKRQFVDPQIRLFFIDEAFMVPDYMVKDILSFGIKVIACGDPNQLPPIGGKPAFLTGYGVHHLTELMRQASNDPIVYLSQRAIRGEPIHCGTYGRSAMVITEDEFDPAMYGLVDVVLCPTNKKREEINKYIRHACGYDVSPFPFFGERIICRQNNWNIVYDDLALANGLSGFAYSLPKPVENASDVFYMDFKPDLTNYVFPNIMMNAEFICANPDRRNEMKSLVKQYPINGELFEYAYAITYHLSQGAEYPNVMMIEENMRPQMANQMLYTAITRAKNFLLFVKQKVNRYY